ncbi:MAG TPA: DUF892 family protein [Patescibacteria group bacterium]|nr:DUF892 family protein [Patescibacteria group bacterium]
MSIRSLEELFQHDLCAMYNGEQQITLALPKMAGAATSPELKAAFEQHLEETKGQLARIEQAAASSGITLEIQLCTVTQALIREGEILMKTIDAGPLLDIALIGAAQKVEHHEIASYTSLVNMATELGLVDAADLLEVTLDEETTTDEKLGMLAEEGTLEKASGLEMQAQASGGISGSTAI